MTGLNKFFSCIMTKIIQTMKKIVKSFTISDLQSYTNRMLLLNRQCKTNFADFVNTINKMPLYFLSQW